MAPADLLLIRHAEPAIDPRAPASSWPLSARGRGQCAALARAIAPHAPAHLAASREPKASETARLVAAELGIGWSVHDGLEEHHRETVRFLPDFPARVAELFARPGERVLGEESAAEALARFAGAIDRLLAAWRGPGPAAAVAHGTVLSLFAAARCRLDGRDLWSRLRCPSLAVLDLAAGALVELHTDLDP